MAISTPLYIDIPQTSALSPQSYILRDRETRTLVIQLPNK